MIEPVDPLERRILDGFEAAPWSTAMDDLGFVEPVDRLGQSVVVAVADAADRGLDPGLGEALGVLDKHILRPAVAMMDEAAPMGRPAIVKRLLQGIEDEAGMGRPACSPANDPPSIGVDNEGDVDEPRLGRDVGEVRDPQHVRRWCVELAVEAIARARCCLVADRGAHWLAPDHSRQAHLAHQPRDRTAGDGHALPHHLPPDLAHAVDREVLGEHARDLGLEGRILPCPRRQARRILSLRGALVAGGWGDRQGHGRSARPHRHRGDHR
jgi:hypothetical protein